MILVVYGTRPEFIKIKPLIDEMKLNKLNFKVLFTGQHKDIAPKNSDFNLKMFDYEGNRLDSILKNCLNIPNEYFQDVTHILVQGDTTTALGLSIAAFHRNIKVIHLEAGLRTYDNNNPYPEEANRQLISRISDINLCPTNGNADNLRSEGIVSDKIYVVGNTGLDNLLEYKNKLSYIDMVLVTLHRRENHDKIHEWFNEINKLAILNSKIKFILPIHPNPNVLKHKELLTNVEIINSLSHEELLEILIKCKLVITDSGGLQEECSFLNKKCLVCRETTERPESINYTTFIVKSPYHLIEIFNKHIENFEVKYDSPFGDGYSSKKICEILKNKL
jgi:UDP-N-acetylglucosamine 2-epimerase (non-hydrolysing)